MRLHPRPIVIQRLILGLLLFAGWWLLPDFEIFGDDFVESRMAHDNWQLIRSHLGMIPPVTDPYEYVLLNLEYYGLLFNLIPYGLLQMVYPQADVVSYEALQFKQACVWFVTILTLACLMRALHVATAAAWAGIAAIITLCLQPYYMGLAWGDMKDIAFAFAITLTSLCVAQWGIWLSGALNKNRINWRVNVRYGVLIGLCIGLATCARIGGLALFAWIAVVGVMIAMQQSRLFVWQSWAAGLVCMLVAALSCLLLVWLAHPVSYGHFWSWLVETIFYHSKHPNVAQTLTDGHWIPSTETGLDYLFKWFAAKTPVIIGGLALYGIYALIRRAIRERDPCATSYVAVFVLQACLFVAIALLAKAHMYMGVRQLLLVCPALAFFAAYALVSLWQQRQRMIAKCTLMVAGCLLIQAAYHSWQLYPYMANYISHPFRSDAIEKRWTVFYDGKQSVQWLRDQGLLHAPRTISAMDYPAFDKAAVITNAYSGALIALYAGLPESHITAVASSSDVPDTAHYFIDFTRMRFRHTASADCTELYRTQIMLGHHPIHMGSVHWCAPDQVGR